MQPFSGPADRNKEPILNSIEAFLQNASRVLEIGSGTGQHALFFAEKMPHLTWIPSDLAEGVQLLQAQFRVNPLPNVTEPVELDVSHLPWQSNVFDTPVDLIYTANTLHIMSWNAVVDFFAGVGQVLSEKGCLIVYGPFKYAGDFTTPSNADFDLWLKDRDRASGVRDFEAVNQLAESAGLTLVKDQTMPANNQCLIWQRVG